MNMIEQVARGLWEAEGIAYGWNERDRKYTWEQAVQLNLFGVGPFRIFARAAIEAMREPTKEMIEPGYEAINASVDFYNYDSGSGYTIADIGPTKTWQAMIDAALNEE